MKRHWNTVDKSWNQPINIWFNIKLWMSRLDWFQFNCNIFICIEICSQIYVTKWSTANFSAKPKHIFTNQRLLSNISSKNSKPRDWPKPVYFPRRNWVKLRLIPQTRKISATPSKNGLKKWPYKVAQTKFYPGTFFISLYRNLFPTRSSCAIASTCSSSWISPRKLNE